MKPRSLLAFLVPMGCAGAQDGPPRPAPPAPAAAPSPTVLAPGEAIEIDASASGFGAELASPHGDEQFVIVLASTALAGAPVAYTVSAAAPVRGRVAPRDSCSVSIGRWREAARSAAGAAPPAAGPRPAGPSVGATRTFTLRSKGAAEKVPTRAVAVGADSVAWADTSAEHPAKLDDAFAAEFQGDFERVILPRGRAVFGAESDIDKDGRIALFFTPLTSSGGVAFFSGCDLAPAGACQGSNGGEVLYLTPANAIRPPYNTPRAMKEILAHELEHLIHHNRKVVRNGLKDDPDAAYMLEGFGGLAQDVTGFQAGNLYVTKAGLDEVNDFSFADLLPDGAEYDRERDGGLRGGAYLFVRWLYDRAGGDRVGADGRIEDLGGPAFVRSLLDAPASVAAELPRQTGASASDLMMDFFTALALGGTARPAKNPCFTYLPVATDPVTQRQRGCDLFASFHGMKMEGPALQPADHADGKLRLGGVEYLKLDAHPGTPKVAFTIAVDPSVKPRVRVVRLH